MRDLQHQAAHAGVAAAGSVSRFWQACQAVSHQLSLECPQFVTHGAARAFVLDWALAGVRLAHPLLADLVLACEGSGGHPPVVQVHKVVGVYSRDEFTGPGWVGARPGGGGGVEEVGAHGGIVLVFSVLDGVFRGGVVSSFGY